MMEPTGKLTLVFRKRKDGKTAAAEQYYKLPLQIMRIHYQEKDGTAYAYLLNPSGGVLQHDRLYTEITLEDESRAYVTTTSSTKFYKMDEGHAEVVNRLEVGSGAVLEYMPEHNVPFAMSRAYQENEYRLHRDSVLIAADTVTAGRMTRGELFQYDLYSSKTKIYVDNRLRLYDSSLMKSGMDMSRLGFMEGYLISGTIYVYAEGLDPELPVKLNAMSGEDVVIAAGRTDDSLMTVRILGRGTVEVKDATYEIWGRIRRDVLGKEPIRVRKY